MRRRLARFALVTTAIASLAGAAAAWRCGVSYDTWAIRLGDGAARLTGSGGKLELAWYPHVPPEPRPPSVTANRIEAGPLPLAKGEPFSFWPPSPYTTEEGFLFPPRDVMDSAWFPGNRVWRWSGFAVAVGKEELPVDSSGRVDWTASPEFPGEPATAFRAVAAPRSAVAAAFTAWPAALAMGAIARHLRRRRAVARVGLCAACGYDLRATPERCPECGTAAAS